MKMEYNHDLGNLVCKINQKFLNIKTIYQALEKVEEALSQSNYGTGLNIERAETLQQCIIILYQDFLNEASSIGAMLCEQNKIIKECYKCPS
jgi:hypothetical protein